MAVNNLPTWTTPFPLLVIAAVLPFIHALPVQDVEPVYVPEPSGRGTMKLIFSCVITLTLCVWTAIHLNIIANPSVGKNLAYKTLWVFIGLFAPELVLWAAFEQWRNAREILRFLQNGSMANDDSERGLKQDNVEDNFGMEGAFFAVMGGYTLGPWGTASGNPLTVTPKGLIYLLSEGMIIPRDLAKHKGDIMDKGKADVLAKVLVCIQALWMVLQCISRKAAGMPITLIELNVVIHVVCTVVMYGFWWKKPLDVGRPLVLHSVEKGFLSLAYAAANNNLKFRVSRTLPSSPVHYDSSPPVAPPCADIPENSTGLLVTGAQYPLHENIDLTLRRIIKRERRQNGRVMIFQDQLLINREKGFCLTVTGFEPYHVSDTELDTFAAAADALRSLNYKHLANETASDDGNYPLSISLIEQGTLFINEASNLRVEGSVASAKSGLIHPILILGYLSLFYGAAHASAWGNHFPSSTELWLWRLSCIFVGTVVPICAVQQSFLEYYKTHNSRMNVVGGWIGYFNSWVDHLDQSYLGSFFLLIFYSLNLALLVVLGISYVLSRLFLVVESFISIRSLPKGAYDTVPWERFWPHL